jgi:hypothetical protein
MITMIPVVPSHGTRLPVAGTSVDLAVPAYERAWKQLPQVVTLGGFGIDNSTGASAALERRRR